MKSIDIDFICLTSVACIVVIGLFSVEIVQIIYGISEVYEISTCQDLMDINNDLDGNYILMNDIDCGGYLNDE